jgi:hypothetical protein
MDLPTLGTNPNRKQHGNTTEEAKDLADLHSLGRIVRVEAADCPRGPGGLSENATRTSSLHLKKRTVCPLPTDRLHHADVRPLLADTRPNLVQPKAHGQTGRKRRISTHEELDKLLAESLLADRPPGVHGSSAWIVSAVRRQQLEPDLLMVNTTFPLPDLLNQPRDCYQITDEGEVPLGDAIPTNL